MSWIRDNYNQKKERKEKIGVIQTIQNQPDCFSLAYPQLKYVIPVSDGMKFAYLHSINIFIDKKGKDWARFLPCLSQNEFSDKKKCPMCKYSYTRYESGFFTLIEFYEKKDGDKIISDYNYTIEELFEKFGTVKKFIATKSDSMQAWAQYHIRKTMQYNLFTSFREKELEDRVGKAVTFIQPVGKNKVKELLLKSIEEAGKKDEKTDEYIENKLKSYNYELFMPMLTYEQALYNIWNKEFKVNKFKADPHPMLDEKDMELIKKIAKDNKEDEDLKIPF